MVLEAFGQALQNFADVGVWLAFAIGVIAGLIFGLIPGISALTGLALFLPFAFFLPPEQALPLMVAMASVSFTGGTITAILLNIPGDAANSATLIDGFPMTQKRQKRPCPRGGPGEFRIRGHSYGILRTSHDPPGITVHFEAHLSRDVFYNIDRYRIYCRARCRLHD